MILGFRPALSRDIAVVGIVSSLQDGFNLYFPVLLLLLTTATYFSLGSRLLSILGFQQFLEQAETTGELVEEGKELARREKRRRERLEAETREQMRN